MRSDSVIVTIPNLITVIRLFSVPLIVWLVIAGAYPAAFWLFLGAGLADAADGFIARRFQLTSQLGAYLDPLADKALLISVYVVLATTFAIPAWLTIMVVSRDFLIIGAVLLSWVLDKPAEVKPLAISKINTVAQILLVVVVLADLAYFESFDTVRLVLTAAVAALTAASAGAYLVGWFRHMNLA